MGGTQITPGLNNINNAFGNIYSMFGSSGSPSGGGPAAFGIQYQNPFSGNDLTQAQRSLTNLMGNTGGQLNMMGTGLIGGGTGVAQGGLGVMGTSLGTLQPSLDFYTKILSGDPSTMTQALAPAMNLAGQNVNQMQTTIGQGGPRGGQTASTVANLPYTLPGQLQTAAEQLIPTAATGLQQGAAEQAQIGQGMAGVGTTLGGLGTTLTGQGISAVNNALQAVLQKMGINLQEPSAFQDILGAVGAAGGILSGVGGIIHGPTTGH